MRNYKSYSPPEDVEAMFLSTCSEVLGRDLTSDQLKSIKLDNIEEKFKVRMFVVVDGRNFTTLQLAR